MPRKIVSPSDPLVVVSLNDPAFNRRSPQWPDALADYLASRHPDLIGALPLLGAERPTRWTIEPLSPAALEWVRRTDDPSVQRTRAFLCSAHSYLDESDHEHRASKITEAAGGFNEASIEWRNAVAREHGQAVIDELGDVAIQRAMVHPRALDPFVWPRGVALAR